jgi:hypothetical protein
MYRYLGGNTMANKYEGIEKITAENLEAVAGGIKWGEIDVDERVGLAREIGLADTHIAQLAQSDKLAAEDKAALIEISQLIGGREGVGIIHL